MKISSIAAAFFGCIMTAEAQDGFCQAGSEGQQCGSHSDPLARGGVNVEGCYDYIKTLNSPFNKVFVYKEEENGWCYPISNPEVLLENGTCSANWRGSSGGQYETYVIHGDGTVWPNKYSCWEGTGLVAYDNSGTSSPTMNPTKSPTGSPTRTSWNIVLPNATSDDVDVDFSADSGPVGDASGAYGIITTKYTATAADGTARLETFLANEECIPETTGNAKDTDKEIPHAGTCSTTGVSTETDCTYVFDKTDFTTEFNFAAADNTLKVCEVARLFLPRNGQGEDDLIIEEFFTNMVLTFNMTQGFDVVTVSMQEATIQSSDKTTSLAEYISASDCSTLVNEKLPPNTPLCVRISSSSSDVLVEKITEMTIKGANAATATSSGPLTVVNADGAPTYPSITSIGDYNMQNVNVQTRVPTNQFNFEATGAAIEVTGSVIIKFAGRRLRVDIDRLLQAANEEETASFGVNVNLASEPELALEGGEEVMMNSANAAAGKAFAILGIFYASAVALW